MSSLPEPTLPNSTIDDVATCRARLARLKAKHFTEEGKATRTAQALQALQESTCLPQLDSDTWKYIAQDADLEAW